MRKIDHLQPIYGALLQDIIRDAFAIVDPDFVNVLTKGLVLLELSPGERLFRQGDISNDVYFLLSGRLRAVLEDGLKPPRELGDVMRGETVGELAFISGEPRMASVVAVRGSLVAKLGRVCLGEALAARPEFALAIMRTVVDRSRQANLKRPAPRRPVTICLMSITPGLDIDALASNIASHLSTYGDRVGILRWRDAPARFSTACISSSRAEISRWIDEFEAAHMLSLFVADPSASSWTRHCVEHADEIVLVANADSPSLFSPIERELFGDREAGVHPRQTLLLLHDRDSRSPTGTAAWLAARAVERHLHLRLGDEKHMKRLARLLSGRGIGIVLSGGGARGFAHVGVIRALSEAGIEADVIGGTSIGSVMGAWQSMGVRDDALVEAARRAFVDSGNPVGDYNAFPFVSLVSGRKVRRLTEQAIRDIAGADIDIDIEDTWTTFFCIAANFSTSEEAILSRGSLSKALLASFAIPGLLPPIVVDGHLHVDGGAVNNLPVDVIERYGLSKIIAVDLLAGKIRTVDYDWVPTTKALVFHRMRGTTLAQLSVPLITELLLRSGMLSAAKRQREMRDRADLCIAPTLAGIGFLDWKKYRAAIDGGAEAARQILGTLSREELDGYR